MCYLTLIYLVNTLKSPVFKKAIKIIKAVNLLQQKLKHDKCKNVVVGYKWN